MCVLLYAMQFAIVNRTPLIAILPAVVDGMKSRAMTLIQQFNTMRRGGKSALVDNTLIKFYGGNTLTNFNLLYDFSRQKVPPLL